MEEKLLQQLSYGSVCRFSLPDANLMLVAAGISSLLKANLLVLPANSCLP